MERERERERERDRDRDRETDRQTDRQRNRERERERERERSECGHPIRHVQQKDCREDLRQLRFRSLKRTERAERPVGEGT